jgi:beta-N-acetylhexosaminidase
MKPAIIGCRVTDFTADRLAAFKEHQPFGMILFGESFKQGKQTVRHVIEQFLSVCPNSKIMIDAEGGVVNRLKPEWDPSWRKIPGARAFAPLARQDLPRAIEAITLNAQMIAHDLMELGITVDCAPVVDIVKEDVISLLDEEGKPHPTSASLYKRSYGDDPEIVTACGKAFADGLHSMGVTSVLKHAPGYGRVATDPHYGLDRLQGSIDDMIKSDFVPYIALKDYPAVMTGHTVYEDIDPEFPATISKKMMQGVMRGVVGFKGVIIADTIEMNAIWPEGFSTTEKCHYGMGLPLPGTVARVTKMLLDAGCDLAMHSDCSGNFKDTVDMLEASPVLDEARAKWMLDKMTVSRSVKDFDMAKAAERLEKLMAI